MNISRAFPRRFLQSALPLTLACTACCSPISKDIRDYHVADTTPIAGATKWDYLAYDATRNRLFITHSDHVDVWNPDTKQIISSLAGTSGVHGVALAPGLNRIFTSNGTSNTVGIFSFSTLKPLGSVHVGKKPDAIVYDDASRRVFAANGDSGTLSAINATSNKTVKTIALNGKPEFAVVDGKGRLFVNIEDKNMIDVVDTKKLRLTGHYNVAPACDEPGGLAIDAQKERLFAGCHNGTMAIVDGNSGSILASLPIGKGNDATAFDAGTHLAFASNGDGTLTIIGSDDADHYTVKQVVKTMPTARTMALDPASHRVYLAGAQIDPAAAPATTAQSPARPKLKDGSFTLMVVTPE